MSIRFDRKSVLALAICCAVGACSLSAAHADPISWTGGGANTSWSTPGNWSGTHTPPQSSDTAVFALTTYPRLPNVDASTAIDGISITGTATTLVISANAGQTLTVGGTGITMSGSAGTSKITAPLALGASQVWTDSTASNLSIGTGAIAGGGNNLTVTNSGSSAAALLVSGPVTGLNNLTLTNSNSGTGTVTVDNISGTGTLTVNGTNATVATTVSLNGIIDGFSAVNISSPSATTVTIGGASNVNTFTGLTTVSSGILSLDKTINIGNGGGAIIGNLTIAGGTVSDYFADMIDDSSNVTISSGLLTGRSSGVFETIGSLTMTGGAANTFTGLQISGAGAVNLSGAASTSLTEILTGTGGVALSGTASLTGRVFLNSNVTTTATTGTGSTLGSGGIYLDGNRTFNVALGSGTTDLTVGGIIADGLTPGNSLTKTGGGVLQLSAQNTFTGGLNIANGKVVVGAAYALPLLGLVNFGGSGTSGTLDLNGLTVQIGGLDNGAGAAPGTQLVTNTGAAAILKIDTTEGNSTFGGTLNATTAANLAITKLGANTQTFTGTVAYTGATVVSRGTLEFVGQTTSATPTLGSISFNVGDGAVQSTYNATNSAQITGVTFSSLATRTLGATGNFVDSGGTSGTAGTTNNISITAATKSASLGGAYFFNGADYAYVDTSGYLRAPVYGGDAAFVNASGSITSSSTTNYRVAASISGQGNASFLTIKFDGTGAINVDQTPGTTLSQTANGGILRSGGGSTTIGGGTLTGASNAEYVLRTDTTADSLTINSTIGANGSNALTKSGAGTLTLGGTNLYTGKTSVDGGTLVAANVQALGTAAGGVQLNGGTLDLATDTTVNAYNISLGAHSTILSDKATPASGGITQVLGTLTLGAQYTNTILTIGSGPNVNGSGAGLAFGATTISGSAPNSPTINSLLTNPVTLASLAIGGQTLNVTGTGSNAVAVAGSVVATANTTSTLNPTTANFALYNVTTSGSANTATVQLSGSATGNTISNGITNPGTGAVVAVTKLGTSTWALSGTSNYTGATSILDGNLEVLGTITASSKLDIGTVENGLPTPNSHATLSGTGSITTTGAITVHGGTPYNSTGHLAPGVNGLGQLTLSSLTMSSGSNNNYAPTLDFTFTTPGASDHSALGVNTSAAVIGALNLQTSNVQSNDTLINLVNGPTAASGPGSYQILTYGSFTNFGSFTAATHDLTSLFTFTGFDGYTGLTVTNDGPGAGPNTGIWVNYASYAGAPVPEPASLAMLGLGAAGLLLRRRRGA